MARLECWCGTPNPKREEVDPDCPQHGDGGGPYGRRTDGAGISGRVVRRG